MEFLDEHGALEQLRNMLALTQSATLAVAFWGDGAIERLALDRPGLALKIICNLESGACNPFELRKLRALAGPGNVLSDPRLHGKVYRTDSGAIVGSSNVSTNGLAVEGSGLRGWAEANLFTAEESVLSDLDCWIDARENAPDTHVVTEEDLLAAEALWKERSKLAPPSVLDRHDLFDAFKTSPDHAAWDYVKVFVWTEGVDENAEEEAKDLSCALDDESEFDYYQHCHDDFSAGEFVIEVKGIGRPRFEDIVQVPTPKIEGETLTFVKSLGSEINLPAFGNLTLSKEAKKLLAKAAKPLLARFSKSKPRYCIVPLRDAMDVLKSIEI
ncbi:phospholipase D family protein [Novosphingobium humi]|uniref:Phospholipase D family protein n=1 Tax=Novosphingobium humi TaxID=2282397 RepID=A0ABY7TSY5_9SPHN|nr:phospholipase D family protein [Novosphingobium humi]WCT76312.1 phospholipase D family protein [Novosphingobium humi]